MVWCTFWRLRINLLNPPKLSCGFHLKITVHQKRVKCALDQVLGALYCKQHVLMNSLFHTCINKIKHLVRGHLWPYLNGQATCTCTMIWKQKRYSIPWLHHDFAFLTMFWETGGTNIWVSLFFSKSHCKVKKNMGIMFSGSKFHSTQEETNTWRGIKIKKNLKC